MNCASSATHSCESRSMTSTPVSAATPHHPEMSGFSPDNNCLESKLVESARCNTSRAQGRHHNLNPIGPLPASIAKGICLPMRGRVIMLHTAIVSRANELAFGRKNSCADRDTAFAQPVRASSRATASMSWWRAMVDMNSHYRKQRGGRTVAPFSNKHS